ncbi:MAG: DUF3106 domain-containing protein [Desulfobacterales bacterium]
MMKHKYWSKEKFKPYVGAVAMMLVILFCFPPFSWSRSKRFIESCPFNSAERFDRETSEASRDLPYPLDKIRDYKHFKRRITYLILTKDYRRRYEHLSPEEKAMLRRRMEEWKSLPPERRRILRHRMERYKRLQPRERHRFRQWYHQLQTLPPDERHMIREKLHRWESLSPSEKEQIRKRFRRP